VFFAVLKRGALLSAMALVSTVLVACSGGNVLAPPGPRPQVIAYTAIGASDAVGYGASVPCDTTIPPQVATPTCPGGTGYVPDIAKSLASSGKTVVTLNDLGITGDVIAPDIAALVNQYSSAGLAPCQPRTGGAVVGNFITDELPKLTGNETLVTIFAGGNDTNGIVNAAICQVQLGILPAASLPTFLAAQIQAFGVDFVGLVQSIRAKAPNAKIVVANLPNFAGIPFAKVLPPGVQMLLQTVSVGIDTTVYQPAATQSRLPVVDLLCDPSSYVPTNFFVDGFHPNDAGYAAVAGLFVAQISAAIPALPQTSCVQMKLVSTAVRPLGLGIPAFDRPKLR